MTWYAAHLIEYFKYRDEPTERYHCYENIVLIEAHTSDEAFTKAKAYGQEHYGMPDPSRRLNDKPALGVFGSVRKVVECIDLVSADGKERPDTGTEITYSKVEVWGDAALQSLIRGESVTVEYVD
jgi:hypothetical protein